MVSWIKVVEQSKGKITNKSLDMNINYILNKSIGQFINYLNCPDLHFVSRRRPSSTLKCTTMLYMKNPRTKNPRTGTSFPPQPPNGYPRSPERPRLVPGAQWRSLSRSPPIRMLPFTAKIRGQAHLFPISLTPLSNITL